ncbi:hypothetical protein F4781DRAFT_413370 [Annulohypoxylon bovei var. microspora]|nr:hypothetical protein F4781DRAFT_413370 [Annulohypoxylon bovei var. microspora]
MSCNTLRIPAHTRMNRYSKHYKMSPPTSPKESDGDVAFRKMLERIRLNDTNPGSPPQLVPQETPQTFKKIGDGGCSAVFAQEGRSLAMKISKKPIFGLWNDYSMHSLIYEQMESFEIGINIPKCYFFVPKEDLEFLDTNLDLIEAAQDVCDVPTDIIVSERIPPLEEAMRSVLIDEYCDPELKSSASADPANNDCLVRIYLGSTKGRISETSFSLRDFELHLNQMIELDLDAERMASVIAQALAVMHWAARTDAMGVQFVLGGSKKPLIPSYSKIEEMEPSTYTGPKSRVIGDFFRGRTVLWLLNFDQVRPIKMNHEGVNQAVQAAAISGRYLPKRFSRGKTEKLVWDRFQKEYLETADFILQYEDKKLQQLPLHFLKEVANIELLAKTSWTRG